MQLSNISAFITQPPESKKEAEELLSLEKIQLAPDQPRRYFASDKLSQLADSIRRYGILQPLLVRPLPSNDSYQLVAGERRFRAAQEAGLQFVPVIVKELSEQEAKVLTLAENLQREDLNPLEETEGILSLLEVKLNCSRDEVISFLYQLKNNKERMRENVFPQQEIICETFRELGNLSWESFLSSRLPLLKLPEDVLTVLSEGKLEYTKARAIAKVSNSQSREDILTKAVTEGLTLSQIKELIAEQQKLPEVSDSMREIQDFSQRLKKASKRVDHKTWKKIQGLMGKIEQLIA